MLTYQKLCIYISASYDDMDSERRILKEFVIPELRKRCLQNGIFLQIVDLRSGLTKKEFSENERIIAEKIADCFPFYLFLFGERLDVNYSGSSNQHHSNPDHGKSNWKYSLNTFEAWNALLKDPGKQPHTFFYFRSPEYLQSIPNEFLYSKKAYLREHVRELIAIRSKVLDIFRKHSIKGAFRDEYECSFSGFEFDPSLTNSNHLKFFSALFRNDITKGQNLIDAETYIQLAEKQKNLINQYGKISIGGLQKLGFSILHDIWDTIETRYKLNSRPNSPIDLRNRVQNKLINFLTERFIGREELLTSIHDYIDDTENSKPILLFGKSCSGKSSMTGMAVNYIRENGSNEIQLIRITGLTREQDLSDTFFSGIVNEVIKKLNLHGLVPKDYDITADVKYFGALLHSLGKTNVRFLFVIDGLENIVFPCKEDISYWLPVKLPSNIKMLLTTSDDFYLHFAQNHNFNIINTNNLTKEDKLTIISRYTQNSSLKLTAQQIESIADHSGFSDVTFLTNFLNELEKSANTLLFNLWLERFPTSKEVFFERLLDRLEKEYGKSLVKTAFRYIFCVLHTPYEHELIELIHSEGTETLLSKNWIPFLKDINRYFVLEGELGWFKISDPALIDTIKKRYLSDAQEIESCYKKLFKYSYNAYQEDPVWAKQCIPQLGIYALLSNDVANWELFLDLVLNKSENGEPNEIFFNVLLKFIKDEYERTENLGMKSLLFSGKSDPLNFELEEFLKSEASKAKLNGEQNWAAFLNSLIPVKERKSKDIIKTQNLCLYKLTSYISRIEQALKENDSLSAEKFCNCFTSELTFYLNLKPDYEQLFEKFYERFEQIIGGYLLSHHKSLLINFLDSVFSILEKSLQKSSEKTQILLILSSIYGMIAAMMFETNEFRLSRKYFEKADALNSGLPSSKPDDIDNLYNKIQDYQIRGRVELELKNYSDSYKWYSKSEIVLKKLNEKFRNAINYTEEFQSVYLFMGILNKKMNNLDEAYIDLTKSLDACNSGLPGTKQIINFSYKGYALFRLGEVFEKKNNPQGALKYFSEAMEINKTRMQDSPHAETLKYDYASTLYRISSQYISTKEFALAYENIIECQRITEILIKETSGNSKYRNYLSKVLNLKGFIQIENKQKKDAVHSLTECYNLASQLCSEEPHTLVYFENLAMVLSRLGEVHSNIRQADNAINWYLQLIPVLEKLIESSAQKDEYMQDLVLTHAYIGFIHLKMEKHSEALEYFNRTLQLIDNLEGDDEELVEKHEFGRILVSNIADAYRQMGKSDQAVAFEMAYSKYRENSGIKKEAKNQTADVPEFKGIYIQFKMITRQWGGEDLN